MPTTLAAGDIAIIGFNSDDPDTFSFVVNRTITSGTQIFFTDRTWNGSAFSISGTDGTFTYTAGTAVAAGTVISVTSAQLTAAGINLNDLGEALYAYQGTDANTPTRFVYAIEFGDGNTTFNASLANTGLTVGTSAVALGTDNAAFAGPSTGIEQTQLAGIGNSSEWVQSDTARETAESGPLLPPDIQLWTTDTGGAGGGLSRVDDNANVASNLETIFANNNFLHPNEIAFDTVHDKVFIVDDDGFTTRILEGSISGILNNPGTPPSFVTLYSHTDSNVHNDTRDIEIDPTNHYVYFTAENADGGTRVFERVGYNPNGPTTPNPSPTVIANLQTNNEIAFEFDIDLGLNTAYFVDSRFQTVFNPNPPPTLITAATENAIYSVSLTPGSTPTRLNFNPEDTTGNTPAESFPTTNGTLSDVVVDDRGTASTADDRLIFTTQSDSGSAAGIFAYNLNGNAAGNWTALWTQPATGLLDAPDNPITEIHVDPTNNQYFITIQNSLNNGTAGIYRGSLSGGTPTLFEPINGTVGGTAEATGITLDHQPTLSVTANTGAAATFTEAVTNPASASVTRINPISADTAADIDTTGLAQNLASASVAISSDTFFAGDQLTIGGATSGTFTGSGANIGFSYNSSNGLMTLTNADTFAHYQAALAAIQYGSTSENPTNYGADQSRTIQFSVSDGLISSDVQATTVTVVGVNDAPSFTPSNITLAETNAGLTQTNTTTITDPDSLTQTITTNLVGHTGPTNGISDATLTSFFSAGSPVSTPPPGTTGTLTYTFNSGAEAFNYLSATEQLAITYNINDADSADTGTSAPIDRQVVVTITGTNDAPVLTGTTPSLNQESEDAPAPTNGTQAGTLVSDLVSLGSNVTDADDNAVTGIAIDGISTVGSSIWFSLDNGATWTQADTNLTDAHALLLAADANTRVYVQPFSNLNGTDTAFNFRAWDQTSGVAGNYGDASSNGGTTAYSSATDNALLLLQPVNDAPVASGSAALAPINEDNTNPPGATVGSLFAGNFDDSADDQSQTTATGASDPNNLAGIAITANAATTQGTWQYSTDNGGTWTPLPAVSDSSAFLLDTNASLRFVPAANYNGAAPALTSHLIDDSSGPVTSGNIVDFTTNPPGGTTQYSSGTVALGETITAVNDAPVLDLDANDSTATGTGYAALYTGTAVPVTDTDVSISDIDNTTLASATITLNSPSLGDQLTVNGALPGNITASAYDPLTGVLTLTSSGATATLAQWQTALHQVEYSNTLPTPVTTTRTISVVVNDGAANSNVAQASITLDQPPGAPSDNDPANNTVAEGAAIGTTVGITASATDPEDGSNVTYSLTNSANGAFTIDSATGVVTVADPGQIDYESTAPGHTLTITVAATDTQGSSTTQDFAIAVSDVDPSQPTDNDPANNAVDEGAAIGTKVGITASSTDVNGPPVTYSLTNSANGAFAIDSSTGVVTVADPGQIDYESTAPGHSLSITVQASDGQGGTSTQDFSITVNDVAPGAPTDSDGTTNGVTEGAAAGTTVGITASSSDVNGGTVTYALTSNPGGFFQIDSGNGIVTVSAAGATGINYETAPSHSYTITVQAADSSNATSTTTDFIIPVSNVPPVGVDDSYSVNEDTQLNVAAPGVLTNDSDVNGGSLSAVLVAGPAHSSSFTLNADGSFSYTGAANYNGSDSFTYNVTDGTDSTGPVTVNLTIDAVNDAPVLTGLGDNPSYTENGPAVRLDSNQDAAVSDAELDVSPNHYAGATLTLARNGGANPDDVFGSVNNLDLTLVNGNGENVTLDGGTTYIGTYTQSNGSISFTFNSNATATQIDEVLHDLTYMNTSDNPPTSAQIDFTFNDGNTGDQGSGGAGSTTGSVIVGITQVDDPPVLSNVALTAAYSVGTPGTVLSSANVITDVDATPPSPYTGISGARVQIVASDFVVGDELFIPLASSGGHFLTADGDPTNISATYAAGLLTLSGQDSISHYQQVLDAVAYRSTAADPSNGGANPNRTITWIVNDGSKDSQTPAPAAGGNPPVNETILHFVTPPAIDLDSSSPGTGYTATFTEDDAPIAITHNGTINDPGTSNLDQVTVVLTNAMTADALSVAGSLPGGIASSVDTSVPGQITLHLTNSASVADYQTALNQVRFVNTSEAPDTTDRQITVTATQGSSDSNVANAIIHVISVNDAPVAHNDIVTLPASQTILTGNVLANDTDVDGDTLRVTSVFDFLNGVAQQVAVPSSGTVTVQSNHGAFTIAADGSYTFAANDTRPAQGHYAEDPLVYSVSDGHGGTAGAQLDVNLAAQPRPGTETFNFNFVNATVNYASDGQVYLTGPDGVTHNVTGVGLLIFNDGRINENDYNQAFGNGGPPPGRPGSALVDDLYYDSQYHDVYLAGVDPEAHYAANGWHEGRNPNAYFNTNYYLSQNGDVAAAHINPLDHYDQYGWREGRNPSANFDTIDYELANPDVAAAGIDPLAHYLQFGQLENRVTFPVDAGLNGPVDGFDPNYYLANYPDVAAAHINPLQHYLQYGWHEGRNPSADFNTNFYEAHNPDVAAAGIDPLIHYDQYGWHEGRDPSAVFSTSGYLTTYVDVAAANINPLQHYLQYGMAEGRSPTG